MAIEVSDVSWTMKHTSSETKTASKKPRSGIGLVYRWKLARTNLERRIVHLTALANQQQKSNPAVAAELRNRANQLKKRADTMRRESRATMETKRLWRSALDAEVDILCDEVKDMELKHK